MVIKNEFLQFKEVLSLMLKSGFLSCDKNLKNLNNAKFLNLFHVLMSMKEFIRNLERVKLKNGNIYIYIEDSYLHSLAVLLLNELSFLKNLVSIITASKSIENSLNKNNLLIVLGKVNDKFFLEAVRNNLYLIHIIDDNKQSISGAYHLHNNISDITKLIFIFALIDQVFASKTETNLKFNA